MISRSSKQNPYPLLTGYGDDFRLRQLLLYFIRLALHILENYLFTYLNSGNAKPRATWRKAMREALEQCASSAKK